MHLTLTWFGKLCLLLALTAGLAAVARASTPKAEPFKTMSVEDVAKHLGKKGVYVFDANGEKIYDEGHVPGATRIDFDAVTADKLPKDKLATLIFYCKNPR